jgi:hypothetical protein
LSHTRDTRPVKTLEEFRKAVQSEAEPEGPLLLRALWHDAKGRWDEAHELAQSVETADGAWVHAYLHRREGDLSNARYWYRRAGRPEASDALEAEWARLVEHLLGQND